MQVPELKPLTKVSKQKGVKGKNLYSLTFTLLLLQSVYEIYLSTMLLFL